MNKKLLALYGLKFNPFSQQVPDTALFTLPQIESFCWRIEQQVGEGGFALVCGDPGTGKSAALRILSERLTIILAGDQRLASRLEELELLPIASRIRSRLRLEALTPKQLQECLNHLLKAAGSPKLLTASLIATLCEHAAGNLRLLMNLANDLLATASHQEREQIDEKLFFEVFTLDPKAAAKSS